MITGISMKYAARSLWRHARRTILSVLGIGLGCSVCMIAVAFLRGEDEMLMRAAANSGAGHLRVIPEKWTETHEMNLRMANWEEVYETFQSAPQVRVAAPHARAEGLLAFGNRVAATQILGVDPPKEEQINRLIQRRSAGRYLKSDDRGAVVIGAGIARRLRVGVGDPIMVTSARSDGEIGSAMLDVVGIAETGSEDLDATICHVNLPDLGKLSGLDGATEIALFLHEPNEFEIIGTELRPKVPENSVLQTWLEIMPVLASSREVDATWTALIVSVIVIVVFLGIASAQLAAVLERRREFAVLAALGMKAEKLVGIMLMEGLVLGVFGAGVALAIGMPVTYWISVDGINFASFVGESMDMGIGNILLEPIIYGDFGWWLIPFAFALSLSSTVLSSFYPAWFAIRTDPSTALRVEH